MTNIIGPIVHSRHYLRIFLMYLSTSTSQSFYEIGIIILTTLQMRKSRQNIQGRNLIPRQSHSRANTLLLNLLPFRSKVFPGKKGNSIWFHESIFVMKTNLFSADTEVLFCAFIYLFLVKF